MTSSLYFLPPTSSPPWLLISSKMSSVACLWGMPHGAAGPDRGVEMPNLMTSAAQAVPVPAVKKSANATSTPRVIENDGLIAVPSVHRSCEGPRGPLATRASYTEVGSFHSFVLQKLLGLTLHHQAAGREH